MWIPHYVVLSGGCILDFKRRIYGKRLLGQNVQAGPDILAQPQACGGWYPDSKQYDLNPTLTTFATEHYRREYLRFATCKTKEELCGENMPEVEKCIEELTK